MIDGRNLLEIQPLVDKKIVIETLERIGISNTKKKVLYPSCYLYTINEKCYLAHFKQMFLLTRDNAYDNMCEDDMIRRNAIAFLLKQWKLIDVDEESIKPHNKYLFILPHKDKRSWHISHKFNARLTNGTINTSEGEQEDARV